MKLALGIFLGMGGTLLVLFIWVAYDQRLFNPQSEYEAMAELCSFPAQLIERPEELGVYLEPRVGHPQIREYLKNLNEENFGIIKQLAAQHQFQTCDFITALQGEPEPDELKAH